MWIFIVVLYSVVGLSDLFHSSDRQHYIKTPLGSLKTLTPALVTWPLQPCLLYSVRFKIQSSTLAEYQLGTGLH